MMNVIISSAINFQNENDVSAYILLSPASLPMGDYELTGVADYKVGYNNIVLLGASGRLMFKISKREVRGMAVDGKPVVIHGRGFEPIDTTLAEPLPEPDPDDEPMDEE